MMPSDFMLNGYYFQGVESSDEIVVVESTDDEDED